MSNESKDQKTKYSNIFLILAIGLVAYLLLSGSFRIPPIAPPAPPGDEPEVTVKSDVKCSYYLFEPAKIQSITNTIVTQSYLNEKVDVALFPFEGVLTLKVAYPRGQVVTVGSQKVKIEMGADIMVTFYWKSKQAGTHIVTARLEDKNGVLTDEKSVEFYIPER